MGFKKKTTTKSIFFQISFHFMGKAKVIIPVRGRALRDWRGNVNDNATDRAFSLKTPLKQTSCSWFFA